MKRLKTFVLFILIFCFGMPLISQNTSTQGKEFWLSFMQNGFRNHPDGYWVTTQVLISAKRDCSGTVSNPLTGWSEPFIARANNVTTIDIPEVQGYHGEYDFETVMQKAIKVVSTDTISVYCTNIAHVSFDASFVLPTNSLGDEYIIQSYDQSIYGGSGDYVDQNETSAFLIIATEDNTDIDITPTCPTLRGHAAGETYSITLNAGETYQVRSINTGSNRDLSGTKVLAADCKRIAVFNGNTLTCIPIDMGNGYDHVVEQAMPLRSWGKNFVVTTSLDRNRDFVKVTSSADNNNIYINGEAVVTLQAYQSYTFPILEGEHSCFIQADFPSAVYLYNNSSYDQNWLGGLGDPSMVWIAPVEQRINEITFTTFDHSNINITSHNVNIIVNTEDIANVYFDDELISPLLFSHVSGNDDYSFIRKNISNGIHHISCANGFNAHVYGFGDAKGYAYLVGSNAIDLSTSITINDELMMPNDSYQYCADQEVTFSVEVNLPEYDLLWSFGDGTTSTQNPVTHTYQEKRIYNAALVVSSEGGGCTGSASDTTNFYIDATQRYINESDETCAGQLYSGYGFNNILINNDTILGRLQDNPTHPECQDSLLLYITAHENYHIPITDSRCWQGEPGIYDDYGFSFEYNEPGVYDRQLYLTTIDGCDSIINLHLTVADQITYEFSNHECGDSYVWDGETYTEPGIYEHSYVSLGGCDSIVTLHLTFGHPQHTSFDTITCSTFYWNGQAYDHSDSYQQQFTTFDGCDSIVDCHLTLSGNVEGTTINITECDSYHWIDTVYTVTGHYEKTLTTALGCDSTIYLDLSLNYSPTPTEIYPNDPENTTPHWVVTATEFQINSYDFYLWETNTSCHWDSVTWNFTEPNGWVLEPYDNRDASYCKMYVLEHIDDTIWLEAHAFNRCAPEGGVVQRYWFICSFYGTEENNASLTHDFEVLPNPNNGQMQLNFEHLTGKIDVKVYDMRGVLIDHFQTANDEKIYDYTMKTTADGLYLFVVSSRDGILTKKVIINH